MEYIGIVIKEGVDLVLKAEKFGLRPYPSYPHTKPCPKPNYNSSSSGYGQYQKEYTLPWNICSIPYGWLLFPMAIGTVGALLLGLVPRDPCGVEERAAVCKANGIVIIYTALASLAFSLFFYYTIKCNQKDEEKSFLPAFLGIALLILFFGAIYFLFYRLDRTSFTGDGGIAPIEQFINFISFSVSTFATAGGGPIVPRSTSVNIVVSIEYLLFIYLVSISLSLLLN